MATVARAPRATVPDRRPPVLLPVGTARVLGFALLATLGVLEWRRMVEGLPAGRVLLWMLVGVGAAIAVLACERLSVRWRALGTVAVAGMALPAAWVAADLDLGLVRPARWPELGDGIARGTEALYNVTLPYAGIDPWPGRVLMALGSLLCVLSGLLAVWPRDGTRGYPILSLVALLVLVAVPVVALGGTRPVLLGLTLAGLVVVFLLLERLPLRPGVGVAALLGLALAGALPLGSAADKDQPWFDYKAFAEGLGPEDPVRFNWEHGNYGAITWTRTGAEVLRIATAEPSYWKVATLDGFDGFGWRESPPRSQIFAAPNIPDEASTRAGWNDTLQVSVRRLQMSQVVGAGTIRGVRDATRAIDRGMKPDTWVARTDLRRGDSYTADVFVPRPTSAELATAQPVLAGTRNAELEMRVPLTDVGDGIPTSPTGRFPTYADVRFAGFDHFGPAAFADYPQLGEEDDGVAAVEASPYARTWRLSQRLRRRAQTPYAYVLAVNRYLQGPGFRYDERPGRVPFGQAPLDAFLFDTKSGYCQHYSAAMALLLRMGGVPARVATGFSPGGFSESRKAWIVRDTDAHSWVEAWFEDIGWVTFDPTPAATPARSQIAAIEAEPEDDGDGGDDGAGGTGGGTGDSGLRPNLPDNGAAFPGLGTADEGGAPTWLLVTGGVVIAFALGLGALALRARRRGPNLDAERAIAELQRALLRTGREAPAGTTLAQLERRLNLSGDAAAYVRALRAGRYAAVGAPPSTAQRRALRRELADGLGPIGRLRVLWALPPRLLTR